MCVYATLVVEFASTVKTMARAQLLLGLLAILTCSLGDCRGGT